MIKTIIVSIVVLFIAILLMGVKVFFTKRGRFPNTHIGASEAMKQRGISCATTQDRQANRKVNLMKKILIENNNN